MAMLDVIQRMILGLALYILGVILTFALSDRYWGSRILGGIVPPRAKLIYEGRPWWTKGVLNYLLIAFLLTALILSSEIFIPGTLSIAGLPFTAVLVLLIVLSILAAIEDRPRSCVKEQ
ncbi:MAG: hypothetical protein EAX95_15690 [Candidatus Thorarchaeota archaeon]|nr:hypothetical protein [Candidatus Thorarchaeota archaeon]